MKRLLPLLLLAAACGKKTPPVTAPPVEPTPPSDPAGAGADAPASDKPAALSSYTQTPGEPARSAIEGEDVDAILAWTSRPYAASSYRVAEATGADAAMVDRMRDVLQFVNGGDLAGADEAVRFYAKDYAGTGMPETARVAVGFARAVLEPTGARWDEVRSAASSAEKTLEGAIAKPGAEALERGALAAVLAAAARADVEQGRWTDALARAGRARAHITKARALAPKFDDLATIEAGIAWWTSLGAATGALGPDAADRRADAIAALREAEKHADLLGPTTTLMLMHALVHDGNPRDARDRGLRFKRLYPNGSLNTLLLAEAMIGTRQTGEASELLRSMEGAAPVPAALLRGTLKLRAGDLDAAEKALEPIAARADLAGRTRAAALTRLARVELRRGKDRKAVTLLDQANATAPTLEATALKARLAAGKGEEAPAEAGETK